MMNMYSENLLRTNDKNINTNISYEIIQKSWVYQDHGNQMS